MKKNIENKHFLANLGTLGLGHGVVEFLEEMRRQEGRLSKTFEKHAEKTKEAGQACISSFEKLLSEKGSKFVEKKTTKFKKEYLNSGTQWCLLGLAQALLDDLYRKEKPNGEYVLEKHQREKLGVFVNKMYSLNVYVDRELKKEEEYQKAGYYAEKWWKVYYE